MPEPKKFARIRKVLAAEAQSHVVSSAAAHGLIDVAAHSFTVTQASICRGAAKSCSSHNTEYDQYDSPRAALGLGSIHQARFWLQEIREALRNFRVGLVGVFLGLHGSPHSPAVLPSHSYRRRCGARLPQRQGVRSSGRALIRRRYHRGVRPRDGEISVRPGCLLGGPLERPDRDQDHPHHWTSAAPPSI